MVLKSIWLNQGELLCGRLHVLAETGHRCLACACKKKIML